MQKRCGWVPEGDELYKQYHDQEWGVPLYNDNKIFEFLILETFQAGLSWRTVLYKRDNFRQAFDGFLPEIVAEYSEEKIEQLLQDKGIIRNRLKIKAAITNAQAFLAVKKEFGSFSKYIWSFVQGSPLQNRWKSIADVPAHTEASDLLSRDLKLRGFKFVGTTVCYAHMQATGMVNDHTVDCFRYTEVGGG